MADVVIAGASVLAAALVYLVGYVADRHYRGGGS